MAARSTSPTAASRRAAWACRLAAPEFSSPTARSRATPPRSTPRRGRRSTRNRRTSAACHAAWTPPRSTTSGAMSGTERLSSAELEGLIERALDALAASPEVRAALESAPQAVRASLRTVLACSDFVARVCARDPQLPLRLLASGELERPLPTAEFAQRAPLLTADAAAGGVAEAQALMLLRRWRQ